MAKALSQIERELQALEASREQLRNRLESTYRQYLQALAQSLEQQLAQAAFQVCTQAAPEAFLALSPAQRQHLQQQLKQLGDRARAQLAESLDALQSGALAPSAEASEEQAEGEASAAGDGALAAESEPDPPADTEPPASEGSTDGASAPPDWLEAIEDLIGERLQAVSLEANQLLQSAGILPQQLPSQVLEAALQRGEAEAKASREANLLTVAIGSSNERNSQAVRVMLVRLRRAELEFGDPGLNSQRNQLHQLRQQYDRLQQQYRQKQQERAVAEAEAAWHASWAQA